MATFSSPYTYLRAKGGGSSDANKIQSATTAEGSRKTKVSRSATPGQPFTVVT